MAQRCPKCASPISEGSRFCGSCGEKLAPDTAGRCPSCGAMNPFSNVFCDECGARMIPIAGRSPAQDRNAQESSVRGLSLPSREPSPAADMPEWLADLQPGLSEASSAAPAKPTPGPWTTGPLADEDTLSRFRETPEPPGIAKASATPREGVGQPTAPPRQIPTPAGEAPRAPSATDKAGSAGAAQDEVPDWLVNLSPDLMAAREDGPTQQEADSDQKTPQWLRELSQEEAPSSPDIGKGRILTGELRAWIDEVAPHEGALEFPADLEIAVAEAEHEPLAEEAEPAATEVEPQPPPVEVRKGKLETGELTGWVDEVAPRQDKVEISELRGWVEQAAPDSLSPTGDVSVEPGELPDWLQDMAPRDLTPERPEPPAGPTAAKTGELMEWLEGAAMEQPAAGPGGLPSWLDKLGPAPEALAAPPEAGSDQTAIQAGTQGSEAPSWLDGITAGKTDLEAPAPPAAEIEPGQVAGWLQGITAAEGAAEGAAEAAQPPVVQIEPPEEQESLETAAPAEAVQQVPEPSAAETKLDEAPEWLREITVPETAEPSAAEVETEARPVEAVVEDVSEAFAEAEPSGAVPEIVEAEPVEAPAPPQEIAPADAAPETQPGEAEVGPAEAPELAAEAMPVEVQGKPAATEAEPAETPEKLEDIAPLEAVSPEARAQPEETEVSPAEAPEWLAQIVLPEGLPTEAQSQAAGPKPETVEAPEQPREMTPPEPMIEEVEAKAEIEPGDIEDAPAEQPPLAEIPPAEAISEESLAEASAEPAEGPDQLAEPLLGEVPPKEFKARPAMGTDWLGDIARRHKLPEPRKRRPRDSSTALETVPEAPAPPAGTKPGPAETPDQLAWPSRREAPPKEATAQPVMETDWLGDIVRRHGIPEEPEPSSEETDKKPDEVGVRAAPPGQTDWLGDIVRQHGIPEEPEPSSEETDEKPDEVGVRAVPPGQTGWLNDIVRRHGVSTEEAKPPTAGPEEQVTEIRVKPKGKTGWLGEIMRRHAVPTESAEPAVEARAEPSEVPQPAEGIAAPEAAKAEAEGEVAVEVETGLAEAAEQMEQAAPRESTEAEDRRAEAPEPVEKAAVVEAEAEPAAEVEVEPPGALEPAKDVVPSEVAEAVTEPGEVPDWLAALAPGQAVSEEPPAVEAEPEPTAAQEPAEETTPEVGPLSGVGRGEIDTDELLAWVDQVGPQRDLTETPEVLAIEAEQVEIEPGELPHWLEDYAPRPAAPEAAEPAEQVAQPEDVKAPAAAEVEAEPPEALQPAEEAAPEAAEAVAEPGEIPDWLAALAPGQAVSEEPPAVEAEPEPTGTQEPAEETTPEVQPLSGVGKGEIDTGELLAWVDQVGPKEEVTELPDGLAIAVDEAGAEPAQLPDWLEDSAPRPAAPEAAEPAEQVAQPEDVKAPAAAEAEAEPPEALQPVEEAAPEAAEAVAAPGEVPDWLAALGPGQAVSAEEEAPPEAQVLAAAEAEVEPPEALQPAEEAPEDAAEAVAEPSAEPGEVPDWLAALAPGQAVSEEPPAVEAEPEPTGAEEPAEETAPEVEPLIGVGRGEIDTTELLAWVDQAEPQDVVTEMPEGLAIGAEAVEIEPGELPDWLEGFAPREAAPEAPEPIKQAAGPAAAGEPAASEAAPELAEAPPLEQPGQEMPTPPEFGAGRLVTGELRAWVDEIAPQEDTLQALEDLTAPVPEAEVTEAFVELDQVEPEKPSPLEPGKGRVLTSEPRAFVDEIAPQEGIAEAPADLTMPAAEGVAEAGEVPDWLTALAPGQAVPKEPTAVELEGVVAPGEVPDWLAALAPGQAVSDEPPAAEVEAEPTGTQERLEQVVAEVEPLIGVGRGEVDTGEMIAWVDQAGPQADMAEMPEGMAIAAGDDGLAPGAIPDWLEEFAPRQAATDAAEEVGPAEAVGAPAVAQVPAEPARTLEPAKEAVPPQAAEGVAEPGEGPDWLAALAPGEAVSEEPPAAEVEDEPTGTQEPLEQVVAEVEPLNGVGRGEVDTSELLAWVEQVSPEEGMPEAPEGLTIPAGDELPPAELPSWLEEFAPRGITSAAPVPDAQIAPSEAPEGVQPAQPDIPPLFGVGRGDIDTGEIIAWVDQVAPTDDEQQGPPDLAAPAQDGQIEPGTVPDWLAEFAPRKSAPETPALDAGGEPAAPPPPSGGVESQISPLFGVGRGDIDTGQLLDWVDQVAPEEESLQAPAGWAPSATEAEIEPGEVPDWLREFAPQPAISQAPGAPSTGAVIGLEELPEQFGEGGPSEAVLERPEDLLPPSTGAVIGLEELPERFEEARPTEAVQERLDEVGPPAGEEVSEFDKLADWLQEVTPDDGTLEMPDRALLDLLPPSDTGADRVQLTSQPAAEESRAPSPTPAEAEALSDWLDTIAPPPAKEPTPSEKRKATDGLVPPELPDWLAGDSDSSAAAEFAEWLAEQEGGGDSPPAADALLAPYVARQPEPDASAVWKSSQESSAPRPDVSTQAPRLQPADVRETEARDWLQPEPDATVEPEVVDWLRPSGAPARLGELAEEDLAPEEGLELSQAVVPDWLEALKTDETEAGEPEPEEPAGPLVGVRGALPADLAIPAHPLREAAQELAVTEHERRHAQVLEQIVHAGPAARREMSPPSGPQGWIEQVVIAVVVLLAVLLPVILGNPLPTASGQPAIADQIRSAHDVLANLPDEALALVAFEYSPATAGELGSISSTMVGHLMDRRARILTVSTKPAGPQTAQSLMQELADDYGYAYGQDYLNLGYIPGGAVGVQAFAANPWKVFPANDYLGSGLARVAPAAGGLTNTLADVDLVLVLAAARDDLTGWIEQTRRLPGMEAVPIVTGVSAGLEPWALPYYQNDPRQLEGIVAGVSGAARYGAGGEQPQQGNAASLNDSQALGIGVAVLLSVIGLIWGSVAGLVGRPHHG